MDSDLIPTQRPNLVFVFADQMRKHAVGFENGDPVVTPNLDRFAAEGVNLTHVVSTSPVCSPYRGMLFTGKYPHSNGVLVNVNSLTARRGIYLKDDQLCFSDILSEQGYAQGYIGKLHLHAPDPNPPYDYGQGPRDGGTVWDAWTPPGPARHGFDFWYSYGAADNHLAPHYWTNGGDAKSSRVDIDEWSVKHETDIAIRYIENTDERCRDPEKPFSLFVSYNPPHPPFDQVPEEYLKIYDGKSIAELLNRPNVRLEGEALEAAEHVHEYFAAVSGIDHQFGRILKALEKAGLSDNTIVVFTADHGEMMGSHGLMNKSVCYDESLRVPFLIRGPGLEPNRKDDLLMGTPDIYPTLFGLMGLSDTIPEECQGTDYSRLLRGGNGWRPMSSFYICLPSGATPSDGYDRRGVFTHRYTFAIECAGSEDPRMVLFDNIADPYQMRNLAKEDLDVSKKLMRELREWLRKTGDPWLTERADLLSDQVEKLSKE